MEAEAIHLFRAFYARSNDKAPEAKRRKKEEGGAAAAAAEGEEEGRQQG